MHTFTVPDMSCGHCVGAITRALKDADGQADVQIDLPSHVVKVQSSLPREAVAKVLTEAGYRPAA